MKYLLVVVVVVVAVWWWLRALRRPGQGPRSGDSPKPPARGSTAQAMVACSHCGVHFPAGDALQADGRHYCSAAHRDAGPGTR